MTRFEKKFIYSPCYEALMPASLYQAGFTETYQERSIQSIYYEDSYFSLYRDSIIGLGIRSKYRLRYYNFDQTTCQLEDKSRLFDYGLKHSSKPLSANLSSNLMIVSVLHHQHFTLKILPNLMNKYIPTIITAYSRRYFVHSIYKNIRVTLDKNCMYGKPCRVGSNKYHCLLGTPQNENILELKYPVSDESNASELMKQLPAQISQNTRNSKYCNGVSLLY